VEAVPHERPRWVLDLIRFLHLKPQFVLSGNIRDHQLSETAPGQVTTRPLIEVLASELRTDGYTSIVSFDPLNGFGVVTGASDAPQLGSALLESLDLRPGTSGYAPAGLDLFANVLERIATGAAGPIVLIADFASRLLVRNDALSLPSMPRLRVLLFSRTKRRQGR